MDIIATLRKALKLSDSAQLSVHPSGAVNHVYRLQNVALHYEGTERKLQFHSVSEKAFRHRQTGQVVEGEQNQGRDPKQSCCVGDFAVKITKTKKDDEAWAKVKALLIELTLV